MITIQTIIAYGFFTVFQLLVRFRRLIFFAMSAKHLLKFGGRLCVCHRPERLTDIFCEMRANGIEPKILREVIQREGKEAWLVLVEGKLGGKNGLTVLEPLYVEKEGILTDEMMEIYGDYKEGYDRRI